MKFYIVKESGVTLGCLRSLRSAKKACAGLEYPAILEVEVPVNGETVRKLLGGLDEYAVLTTRRIIE